MKTIMITAPSSGSGKTMITMGLIRALKNIGYNLSCFKTGPDYIDTAFLAAAAGKEAGNLDVHLQGRVGMQQAFSLADGDLCVVEGAMGYFDGIYNTFEGSSYAISRELAINTLLVYTPQGEMFTTIPKIKGMVDFEESKIKGVILNRVTEATYKLLKVQIEKYTSLAVLGFVPKMDDLELKSRHLGLVQSMEIDSLDEQINKVAETIAAGVDLDALINLMSDVTGLPFPCPAKRRLIVAVARDKAFSFYYRENLKLLEKACEVQYFSPLDDVRLPDCDLLYLGGGYPEVFRDQLAANRLMLASIKDYADRGGCIYAECGGMMYLNKKIEEREAVGIFKGESKLTDKLQRFGYIDITLLEDCLLGSAGSVLTAHEFHKSECATEEREVFQIRKTMGTKTWACGYRYKNVLAAYPHINFLGNMDAFAAMLDYAESCKLV
jgi:cobyrinic acid a,c-diamide synthase